MLINASEAKLFRAQLSGTKVTIDSLGKSFLVGKMPALAQIKMETRDTSGKSPTELDALVSAFEHACTDGTGEPLTAADAHQVAALITMEELHGLLDKINDAAKAAALKVPDAVPAQPPAPPAK